MKFFFLPLINFHLLLRLFPHVTHLTFATLTFDNDFISPTVWHDFLSMNFSQLQQLQFHIEIKSMFNRQKRTIVKCIRFFKRRLFEQRCPMSTDGFDRFISIFEQPMVGWSSGDGLQFLIETINSRSLHQSSIEAH